MAGIAPLHDSVKALDDTTGISDTSPITPADVNMMILGMAHSILIDPTLVVGVSPLYCTGSDCTSLFLPGGLELVRRPDGSTLFTGQQLEEPVIIVHDAPGYQLEFSPTDFKFNFDTDCHNYGLPISSLYACIAFSDDKLLTGERMRSIVSQLQLLTRLQCRFQSLSL
jgi:hypothetical protein